MASATNPSGPGASATAEQISAHLDLGISLSLLSWPALTLSVANSFGGPSSADKREWFAGAISDLFATRPETDLEDVETVLLQVMLDEFEVAVDDDSAYDVAERIVRIRMQCERGDFAEVVAMREEWARRGGREVGVSGLRVEREEGSEEESSEEESEEEDVEMEEAEAPRERRAPEIDEEGFQTVVSRKKR